MDPVVTPVVAFGVVKGLTYVAGFITAAWAANKVTQNWGNNPANNLEKLGISPKQQYEDYKKLLEDKAKFIEDKTEEHFKDLKERREKLEEENKKLLEKLSNTSDPQERTKILEEVGNNKKEISDINKTITEGINKIIKNFDTIGRNPPLTQEQFQDKSKRLDLGSWWNWGLIAFCVIIAILIINFVRKILSKFASMFG